MSIKITQNGIDSVLSSFRHNGAYCKRIYASNTKDGITEYVLVFESEGEIVATRKVYVLGNWKTNRTYTETASLITNGILPDLPEQSSGFKIGISPSTCNLKAALDAVNDKAEVGVQLISWEGSGAYTGQVSAAQVKELGCTFAFVGQSETRHYLGITDEQCNKMLNQCWEQDLTAILFVGEDSYIRDVHASKEYIGLQLKKCLAGISIEQTEKLIIAYEPIWAIGTGKTATTEDVEAMCKIIRQYLTEIYYQDVADNIPILYAGSTNVSNSSDLASKADIDGSIVGGASMKPDFGVIATNFKNIKGR